MKFDNSALEEVNDAFKNASTFWKSKFCKVICVLNENKKGFDWSKESFVDDLVKKYNNGKSIQNREDAVTFLLDKMDEDQLFKQCLLAQDNKDNSTCEDYKGADSLNLDGSTKDQQKEFLKIQFDIKNQDWCKGLVLNNTPKLKKFYPKSLRLLEKIQSNFPTSYVEGIDMVIDDEKTQFHLKNKASFAKVIKEGRFQFLRAIDLALFSSRANNLSLAKENDLFTDLKSLFTQIADENEKNNFGYDSHAMIWVHNDDIENNNNTELNMTQQDLEMKCSSKHEENDDINMTVQETPKKRSFNEFSKEMHIVSPEKKKGKNKMTEESDDSVMYKVTEKGKEEVQKRFGVPVLKHHLPVCLKSIKKDADTSNEIRLIGMKDCRAQIKSHAFQQKLEVLTGKPIPVDDGFVKLFICVRPISKDKHGQVVKGGHFMFDMTYFSLMNTLIADAFESNAKLEIGSNDEMTQVVTSCLIRTCPIRVESSSNKCYETKISYLAKPMLNQQAYGILTFEASSEEEISKYIKAFVKEIEAIIHHEDFFSMFKKGIFYKEYCGTSAKSSDVLQKVINFQDNEDEVYKSLAVDKSLEKSRNSDAKRKCKWELILDDKYNFMKSRMPSLPVIHIGNMALDEMIPDEKIKDFIQEVMGLYHPAYETIFFKNGKDKSTYFNKE